MSQKVYWTTHNRKLPQLLNIHFIGIGGIGISALAQWLFYFLKDKKQKLSQEIILIFFPKLNLKKTQFTFSGSDIVENEIIKKLRKKGFKIKIGHYRKNIPINTKIVVYNQAIEETNPEIIEAKKRKLLLLSYPQFLGILTKYYQTITISGSHGKSTTTALVGLILKKAKPQNPPNIFIGTKLKELNHQNFLYSSKSRFLVIEADEWKAAFLNYSPSLAIILNIDREHLDFYKNLNNLKKTFLNFIKKIKENGSLILNLDDKNLKSLAPQIKKISKNKKIKVFTYSLDNPSSLFLLKNINKIKKIIKIKGKHNLSNAVSAFLLAKLLKISNKTIFSVFNKYQGSWRRMEFKGYFKFKNKKFKNILIYDDYAHHPTEIKATLQAFKNKNSKTKTICVFQPHQNKRLKLLFKDFQKAFKDADYLILLPIYKVKGRDQIDSLYTSKTLFEKIKNNQKAFYLPKPQKIKEFIYHQILKNEENLKNKKIIIVMMGAGDIVNFSQLLIK